MPLEITMTNEEKVRVTARPTTTTGRPASLDGPVRATVVSGNATAEPDPNDPNTVVLISSDDPGDTSFLIEADADLGTGVVLIQDTVTLHVNGAQASNLGITAGTPEPK
jgi:hypothetical protein